MECLKLISADILVSFPRPFSYKKPVYALFTVLVVKNGFSSENENFKTFWKLA